MVERRHRVRRESDRVETARSAVHSVQVPLLRRIAMGALTCWATIATVGFVALAIQAHDDHRAIQKSRKAFDKSVFAIKTANTAVTALDRQQQIQHLQLENGCRRLNVERALTNDSNAALFRLFQSQVVRTRGQFHVVLRETIDALDWTPLTNCLAAVALHGPN